MLFRIMEFVCKSFRNAELSLAALAAKNGGWLVGWLVCVHARAWRIAKDGRKLLTNRRLFENRRVKGMARARWKADWPRKGYFR